MNVHMAGWSRYVKYHCNAVITRVTGAIKSNRVISDTAL